MKHLRLSEEQLAAILAKQRVRVVKPAGECPPPVRGPSKKPKRQRRPSGFVDHYANFLSAQLKALHLPEPKREFKFAAKEGRRWRFDLCWPEYMVAVEIDSMVHRTKDRYVGDMEKYNAAGRLGWRLIRCLPLDVRSGAAASWIEVALKP